MVTTVLTVSLIVLQQPLGFGCEMNELGKSTGRLRVNASRPQLQLSKPPSYTLSRQQYFRLLYFAILQLLTLWHKMPELPAFEAQPQETVLNAQGQQALKELLQAKAARKRLQHRLDSAVKRLTYTAGQLNDRASDQRIEYEKRRRGLE